MSDGIRVEVMYIPKMSADAREMVNAGGKLLKPKIECAAYQFILTKPLDLPHLLLLKTFTEDKSSVYQVFNGWGVRNEGELHFFNKRNHLSDSIFCFTCVVVG